MSLFDKVWYWGHVTGGVGAILDDPVDTILRRLSVGYLDEAKGRAVAELTAYLGREPELTPVSFHPYKGNWFPDLDPSLAEHGPFLDREDPFLGVGWVDPDAPDDLAIDREHPGRLRPEAREACVRLLAGHPRLALCGGGRWARFSRTATGSEAQLAAMLAFDEEDFTGWTPLRPAPDAVASTLWARAQAAADRCDAAELRELVAEARRVYSPAGWRMLRSGVLDLLAFRLAESQEVPVPTAQPAPGG